MLPSDLRNLLAEFGSAEMVEIRQERMVRLNASIAARRQTVESRWWLQWATDEQLLAVGIHPNGRQLMLGMSWRQIISTGWEQYNHIY